MCRILVTMVYMFPMINLRSVSLKGLLGTIGLAAYIVKKYSDYVNYGGLYSESLQGKFGLEKGLPIFPNRLVDLRDDAYRRRRRMIAAGMIYWMISSAALKQAVRI